MQLARGENPTATRRLSKLTWAEEARAYSEGLARELWAAIGAPVAVPATLRRSSRSHSAVTPAPPAAVPPNIEAFSFGEPEPVLDRRKILDYLESLRNGKWYVPSVSFAGLAKSFRASPHHSSAIYFKANILASTLEPHALFSRDTCQKMALDFLTFGNAYCEKKESVTGKPLGTRHALAKYTRRGIEPGQYFLSRPSVKSTNSRRVRSATWCSPTSTRKSMDCRNTSRRSMPPGSMNQPPCSAASTT